MFIHLTDRKILKRIYRRYYSEFNAFKKNDPESERETKIFVPIDCEAIAKEFKVDKDIIFGRLYYHLNKKYGYVQPDGTKVSLFAARLGNDKHAVHFPLLSAVIADLEQSWIRFNVPIVISLFALLISILSVIF